MTWQPLPTLGQAVDLAILSFTAGGDHVWYATPASPYYGHWSAGSGDLDAEQSNWLQTTVEGEGSFSFWWKAVSSDTGSALTFWIDGQTRDALYGDQNAWQQKTYTITGSGPHTVKWTFSRSSDEENSGMGYVDCVQWTGSALPAPEPPIDRWHRLAYQYDAAGRRVAKSYNEELITKYIYDGDHCIAEYDPFGHLRRKYIYGPSVDEPISMIEAGGSYAGTYYYHFDALGSVVGLTNASGNTVEVYEYETYGRVGASDASHPNRIMFTGREYDKETGLYYYRARYYNPQIGRFLQTDPVGYGDGMNLYRYCSNNPSNWVDPSGLQSIYVYHEVEEGLSFFYELTPGANGVEWNLAGIASWQHVDPSQVQVADFGPGITGYVIRGRSTGYSDPTGTMGNAKMLGDDPTCGTGVAQTQKANAGVALGMGALAGVAAEAFGTAVGTALGIVGAAIGAVAAADALTDAGVETKPFPAYPLDEILKATRSANDLPARNGPPNGSRVRDDGKGHGQIRDYGADGRATKDYDFGHDHGSGDPHVHDWDWSKVPPRQPGRPLGPGD